MSDIIQLLPDSIANQIAAGEVVQRPSNVVKELIENAIDAEAKKITIIIEEGGKKLIQITDDGKGMSTTDSRMCFERHATSKIKTVEDIFRIRTMGFRGEALASIAAVSTVTLKTKMATNEIGTLLEIENSKVLTQEPTMCANGTSITVKNLFFTVPARKHFLKTDKKELEYIIDEFIRIAIPFYHITFELIADNKTLYHLQSTNSKNRLLQIYKNYYTEEDLINIKEKYNDFSFTGFLGKPEVSRTTRGHQFFFVNLRFIKNNYLAHSISSCFENLIKKEQYPTYFIFIEIDPKIIDINVHPNKQEIKFQDEKTVYSFLHSAVKHSFSKYAVTPSIDFDLGSTQNQYKAFTQLPTESEKNNTLNSTLYKGFTKANQAHFIEKENPKNWRDFFEPTQQQTEENTTENNLFPIASFKEEDWLKKSYIQFENEYIITTYKDNIIIINQQLAHQIILYEKYLHQISHHEISSENILFPTYFKLSPEDEIIFDEIKDNLKKIGYEINKNNDNQFSITAIPIHSNNKEVQTDIEKIIESYKYLKTDILIDKKTKLIRCLSLKNSIKIGRSLKLEEMQELVHNLFLCENPLYAYGNIKSFILIEKNKLDILF